MKNSNPFPQPISQEIWDRKYKLTTPNPEIPNDITVQDTWKRIAKACAESPLEMTGNHVGKTLPESYIPKWQARFYEALSDFKFLPAGRIIAGAGTGRSVTLFNCYVMGTIPDSLSGIFNMLKEAALTMQQGGGIGYDFTPLRPKGSPVKKVDADASGPLSFMDCWDSMCRTIMSAGSRRGAMMATMHCRHPDIRDFITAKREDGRLRMFNLSVMASDDFMQAVLFDTDWPLTHKVAPAKPCEYLGSTMFNDEHVYEVVQARDLWNEMMKLTFNHAEPGVLFIDHINKMNNLWYIEEINSTNPCGEQPLPPYGACLLGSINLAKMVINPFEDGCYIDYNDLEDTTRVAVRLLDSVIDISNFPLPEQKAEAKMKRRMGLGITGLANMLFMLNQTYGSERAAMTAEYVMRRITLAAYWESVKLAKELGPCPATETLDQRSKFTQSGFMSQEDIPQDLKDAIMEYGIRNALLTSIAPTGTISLYAGNVSSGIEPVFAERYERGVLEDDGKTRIKQVVEDYGVLQHRLWLESTGQDTSTPSPFMVTAQTLQPKDHLVMQAGVQKWTDSSISKTINCPTEISFEDFKDVYMDAYNFGLKGCTTYRPNETLETVLNVIVEEKETEPKTEQTQEVFTYPEPSHKDITPPRNKILSGQTYKLKWQDNNFYVTINNYYADDGKTIPFEIFINTQDMSHFQWTTALTRMMSSVFRRNGDISFVIEDLKSIMDPNGGAWVDGRYLPSFIALLGATLEDHVKSLTIVDDIYDEFVTEKQTVTVISQSETTIQHRPMQCTSCKGFNVHISGGCPVCGDCGHSKCG